MNFNTMMHMMHIVIFEGTKMSLKTSRNHEIPLMIRGRRKIGTFMIMYMYVLISHSLFARYSNRHFFHKTFAFLYLCGPYS